MAEFIDCSPQVQKSKPINMQIESFISSFEPLELASINILQDKVTNAIFCECHIRADKLLALGTVDAPLDPEQQPEYRANRDLVDSAAFDKMKDDAKGHRIFSNIVAEYNISFDDSHPLKIIGGQHRFTAIREAYSAGVNELHGVKVYFNLDSEQRLDVQLISNTNIAVSSDLLDRMFETVKGPQLRDWCQKVGLLDAGCDFADRKQRGSRITVRGARTFILNYYLGRNIKDTEFDQVKTNPIIAKTGGIDLDWENLKEKMPKLWEDKKLIEAGKQFARLNEKQSAYYSSEDRKKNKEYADKALTYAILAAWAYVSGVLSNNAIKLKRHFSLADIVGKDPLNAIVLAKARHKTDPANYRGLGSRTDIKDCGRLAELFFSQAEKGEGINKKLTEYAIMKYHAKQAQLEVLEYKKRM